jgi:hypothetical protein
MAGITYFVALPFDVADGSVVVGDRRSASGLSALVRFADLNSPCDPHHLVILAPSALVDAHGYGQWCPLPEQECK